MPGMKTTLLMAVAQCNLRVADLAGNRERLVAEGQRAQAAGAALFVTPELALCGYPPEDLLLRPDFHRACARELATLVEATAGSDMLWIIGHPRAENGLHYNSASLIRDGRVLACYDKQRLPNATVFDEVRYFAPGQSACVVEIDGLRIAPLICEDVWGAGPAAQAREAGAELLVVLNASPFHVDKQRERIATLHARQAESGGLPVLYCNLVGGQDELVFDGASCALDADGSVRWQAALFEETLGLVNFDLADRRWHDDAGVVAVPCAEAQAYGALVLGVRDYVGKNGFPGALLGLSGGLDSALTLCVAVDALGPERVRAVMLQSPYTAQMSLDDSRALVATLGVQYDEIPIAGPMQVFETLLAPHFAGRPADTTEENLQSRIRGMILMALSNKFGGIVLITGNKSEMATGYSTLYGDMAGGFAVLKDVYKTFAYRIARWLNRDGERMPWNIITRPPSAELKPDQTDQDSLPPYEILDAIIAAYMERDESPREIIAAGLPEADVRRTVRLLRLNEYKRRQAPVGVRVTRRSFGKDWRYPITNKFRA